MLPSSSALDGMVQGLEEVLVADPEDLLTHRAYANVLIQQRHASRAARGRLIETQLKLEQPTCPLEERPKLERRVRKLLKDCGRDWLEELAPFLLDGEGLRHGAYHFELARGWLDTVVAPILCPHFMAVLARAPQARLLRSLVVQDVGPCAPAALAPLFDAPFLPRLRVFRLGSAGDASTLEPDAAELVEELVARMPRLIELATPWHPQGHSSGTLPIRR